MTIDEMKRIKDERGYSFTQISEYSGVPAITLRKIFCGQTKNPRPATLAAVERVLTSDENIYTGKAHEYDQNRAEIIGGERSLKENGVVYGAKTDGAPQDYAKADSATWGYAKVDNATQGDSRTEIIDGKAFAINAPDIMHKDIISYIHMEIYSYIRKSKCTCRVYESPIDVQLDQSNKTMVEPDLVVICDTDKIRQNHIAGAPDFILEVLSESTRRKDMLLKSYKYLEAGVREYWMIDPDKRTLIKYDSESDDMTPTVKPLKGIEPLDIFEGKLKIDLGEVASIIEECEKLP